MAAHNKDVDGPTPLIKRDALLGLIDRSAPAQAHVHTVPRERLRARTGDVVAGQVDGDVDVDVGDLNVDVGDLNVGVDNPNIDDLDVHKRYVDNLELENRYIDNLALESRESDHGDPDHADVDHRDAEHRDVDHREPEHRAFDHRDPEHRDPAHRAFHHRGPDHRMTYQDLDDEMGPSVSPLLVLGIIALLIVTFIAATQLR